ncbi:MAG TPA: CoA transferase, partial [Candidatus Baltobacteraceae bacterium]|nr:CoA transferase [Candidatus Baltobacteraceae bacterium]
RGDPLETAAPHWYAAIAAGIQIVRIDLRDGVGLRTLDALLQNADLVVTAMRRSSLLRIGFEWESLHARYPRLSHIAISGEAPPHDDRAGHDLTYQARAGTVAPPAMPRALVGDMAAAERAVTAAMTALLVRERSGEASRIDVSIVECATDFAAPFRYGLTAPSGELGGALATYGIYAANTGHVAVAALEPHFVERLQRMLGDADMERESLARTFSTRSAHEWETLAEQFDVPLAAVREREEAGR